MQIQQTAIPPKEQSSAFQNKGVNTETAVKSGPKMASETATESSSQKGEQTMYLKVLSRLENMIQKGELPEKALEGFLKAVNARLKEASAQDKKVVLSTPEAKALEIMKFEDFSEKIQAGLEEQESSSKTLALLKQPKFVEIMNGQENPSSAVYGPNGKTASAQKPATEAQPPHPGTAADPKQAIAALKSMQTDAQIAGAASNVKPPITAA